METVHVVLLRPRYEGANIGVWLGFKHITYVMEEAILDYFRNINLSQRIILLEYDSRLEIRFSKIELLKVVHTDDLLNVEISKYEKDNDLSFKVTAKDNEGKLFFRGIVKVLITIPLRNENKVPENMRLFYKLGQNLKIQKEYKSYRINNEIEADFLRNLDEYKKAFIYSTRMPYHYCHYKDFILHSAYIRIVEDAVDRFLDYKEISVGKMLKEKNWIPIVTKSSIEINDYAFIEEDIIVVFTVKDILKDILYVSDLNFFVKRNDKLIEVASASIIHGYSCLTSESEGYMVTFDSKTINALRS